VIGVLLDDRKEVRQQPSLQRGKFGPSHGGAPPLAVDPVDRKVRLDSDRARVSGIRAGIPAPLVALGRRRLASGALSPARRPAVGGRAVTPCRYRSVPGLRRRLLFLRGAAVPWALLYPLGRSCSPLRNFCPSSYRCW
jgi:hypothetical protein